MRSSARSRTSTRLPARGLAASLGCQGRRYDELSSALERLLAEGIVDRAQRSDASSGRGRGYALTERGRRRAECLRQASDSGASTNRGAPAACSAVASTSEVAFPAVGRSGNATLPAGETSAEGCSETVSEAAFPAVDRSGNATPPAGEASAACSAVASVSGAVSPAVGGNGNATLPAGETQRRPVERCRRRVRRAQTSPAEPGTSATRLLGMGGRSPRVDGAVRDS